MADDEKEARVVVGNLLPAVGVHSGPPFRVQPGETVPRDCGVYRME